MAQFTNSYTVAGLDVQGIETIKKAIDDYTSKIKASTDSFNTSTNTDWNVKVSNAIKGTASEASVKNYISGITAKCNAIIADLENFKTALDKLKSEMQQVHIQSAKLDPREVKENFGKVIMLDERSRAFETMHRMTAKEIADIKIRISKDGK